MEEKKKKYIAPEMRPIQLKNADVIITSSSDNDGSFSGFTSYSYNLEEFR